MFPVFPCVSLLLGVAEAAPVIQVRQDEATGISDASRPRRPLLVRWTPTTDARIDVRTRRGRWRVLKRRASSPYRSPPLFVDSELRVTLSGQLPVELRAPLLWTPADIATWSGPGLAGARVVDLVLADGKLWAATWSGGIGRWNGTHWTALHRRQGLSSDRVEHLDVSLRHTVLAGAGSLPDFSPLPPPDALPGLDTTLELHDAIVRSDGAWLATDHGLHWLQNGEGTPVWAPPDHEIYGLAQAIPGPLLLAAGRDGLWTRTASGRISPVPQGTGLPSPDAWSVTSGPRGKAWIGTGRGVALYDTASMASALPLAPLAAGIPAYSIVPHRRGAGVITSDGLVWLGEDEPTGWKNLVAATGPEPIALLHAHGDWWSIVDHVAFRVDSTGSLERWPLPSPPRGIVQTRSGVGFVTESGIHWWLPDATQLSPLLPLPAPRTVSTTDGDLLWILTDAGVTCVGGSGEPSWELPPPRAIRAVDSGAWVATSEGLYQLGSDGSTRRVSDEWPTTSLVSVAATPRAVWAASDDGRLFGPDPNHPSTIDLNEWLDGVRIHHLVLDDDKLWISTDQGLFLQRDPDGRRRP